MNTEANDIKEIRRKINLNPIPDFTEDEWNIISQSDMLIDELATSIKKGYTILFDCYNIPASMSKFIYREDIIEYVLDSLKKTDYESYVQVFADSVAEFSAMSETEKGAIIEEYGYDISTKIISIFEKNKEEILDGIIDYINEQSNNKKPSFEILNKEVIEYAIKKDCYLVIQYINPEIEITPELEDFIIKNVDKIDFKLNIYSDRIADAFISSDKGQLLYKFYDKRQEINDAAVKSLDILDLAYYDVSADFYSSNIDKYEMIMYLMKKGRSYTLFDNNVNLYKFYLEHPEAKEEIIEFIIEDGAAFKEELEKDFSEIIYKDFEFFSALIQIDNWMLYTDSRSEKKDEIKEFIINNIDSFCDLILEQKIEHNYKILNDIISAFGDTPEFNKIYTEIISSFTFEEFVEFKGQSRAENFEEITKYFTFTITSIPPNYNYSIDYGEDVIIQIIPLLREARLSPERLPYFYYDTPKKLELIIERAASLSCDGFNDHLYRHINEITLSEKAISIIKREDNPLGLTLAQISKITKQSISTMPPESIKEMLSNTLNIDQKSMSEILIFVFGKDGSVKDKIEILNILLNKIDSWAPSDLIFFYNCISDANNGLSNSTSNEVKETLKNFLMKKDNVPISLSRLFDHELREKSTYTPDTLLNHPGRLLIHAGLAPNDYNEFIEKSMAAKLPIDISIIIAYAINTKHYDALKYENIGRRHIITALLRDEFTELIKLTNDNSEIFDFAVNIMESLKLSQIFRINGIYKFVNDNNKGKEKLIEIINSRSGEVISINSSSLFFDDDIFKAIIKMNPDVIIQYLDYCSIYSESNLPKLDYSAMIQPISKKFEIPEENLREFYNTFGSSTILMIKDSKVQELLKKDKETIKKFIDIFSVRDLDQKSIEAINDSLQQRIFAINNPNIINIFNIIMNKIQYGITDEDIEELISILCEKKDGNYIYLPKRFEDSDTELEELFKTNKEEFIRLLIKKLQENQNKYTDALGIITSNYIREKRNEVNRKEDIFVDTNVKFKYDKKDLYEAYFKYSYKERTDLLLEYMDSSGLFSELDKKTILLLAKRIDIEAKEATEIKKNIAVVKKKLEHYFDTMYPALLPEEYIKGVKKNIIPCKRRSIIDFVEKIDFDVIYKIIEDEKRYTLLTETINKLKLLDWGNVFDPSIKELTPDGSTPDIYNFINSFNAIYDIEMIKAARRNEEIVKGKTKIIRQVINGEITLDEVSKNDLELIKAALESRDIEAFINNYMEESKKAIKPIISAYSVLAHSFAFSSYSPHYTVIFGMDDYELIVTDPGPYQTHYSKEEKLDYCIDMSLKMMDCEEITIPSFIKDYTPTEGKKPLRAIVGCKADPRNLTHGERTGACMRAGGVAHDLFTFANADERGFNITFTDPETGEYISRVTGFRNGNTVCLNQLRFSLNEEKYPNEYVIEVCKAVAKDLVEKSKDSEMPIENVICSATYALKEKVNEIKEITKGSITDKLDYSFSWLDVNEKALVLATTGENGKPVEFKPDGKNQPKYKPCRLPMKVYTKIDMKVKMLMQRISAFKLCLSNKDDPEYCKKIGYDINMFADEFIYVIIGQDYYVALKTDGTIVSDYIFNREDTLAEYNEATMMVEQQRNSISIGGKKNEL